MPPFQVVLRTLATVEIEAGSPDEAVALAQDALADVPLRIPLGADRLSVQLGLDADPLVSVAGEGEDPGHEP